MSRILAVILLATNLTIAGSGQQVQTTRPITTREELNAMTLKAAAPNVRSVAKILKDEKVDIDPELLLLGTAGNYSVRNSRSFRPCNRRSFTPILCTAS